ncbi:hypothetical protein PINS_up006524 [Pythium insidiosum]|nr:hypothetical protein PINS_up006524 [Pythium insidiosum]
MAVEPRTVKALAAHKVGLKVEPFEYVARPLGANDVEIAISHCGICGSDLHTIGGGWGGANYPVVPGHEIVGKITAAGAAVKDLQLRDRQGLVLPQDGLYTYNANVRRWREDIRRLRRVRSRGRQLRVQDPEALPSDVAAPLLCAGVTVYTPLKQYVKPGYRVGVVGIGGLGHLALQFVKALGGIPVAFSQSPNKEEQARALGAEDFVVMRDPEAVKRAARSVHVH